MHDTDGGDAVRGVPTAGGGSPVGDAPSGDHQPHRSGAGSSADGTDVPAAGPGAAARPVRRAGAARLTAPASARLRTALVGVVGVGAGLLLGGVVGGQGGPPSAVAGVTATAPAPVPTVTVTRRPPPRVLRPESRAAEPTRLVIPALGIDQGFVDLGITGDGSLEVPTRAQDIGWWSGGPAPGDPGGAVVAAHVRLGGEPAAFLDLGEMEPGQEVVVGRADASVATYRVTSVEQFAKDAFPEDRVYTSDGASQLHLITCGGEVDPATGHYLDNVVVFADLVDETPPAAEGDPGDETAEESTDA
ncbi:sortase [Pseudokineococcus basanitobsidens]|uniref:Sortase n=1 Tax=Pseudokineococcus basanitobsidens TaxID=1926649 RepID=A0ABU8RGF9_9ACTN